ncbi:MAG: methyltransferase domain-containing protein [Pseudomonadota bacterium]
MPVTLQSLFIQLAALALAALAVRLLPAFTVIQTTLWQFVLIQGAFAGGLSLALRQPRWWLPLHVAFLPAAFVALQFDIAAGIYLAGFILLRGFFWTTFRTRVPLYLSDRKAWDEVAAQLPVDRRFRFVDLGSGLGGLLFNLEKRFPRGEFTGVELAPASWAISRLRARLSGSRVCLLRQDYAALDLGGFDVVFAFLSPAAMPALWAQACAQMRAGSCLMSLSFGTSDRAPDAVVQLAPQPRHRLYIWRMRGDDRTTNTVFGPSSLAPDCRIQIQGAGDPAAERYQGGGEENETPRSIERNGRSC